MDIAAMKQAAEAATPGPWEIKESLGVDEAWCEWRSVGPFTLPGECAEKDDRFIAAANPSAVLELIASHEQLVAALKFYANPARWDDFRSDESAAAADRNIGSALGDDSGEIARVALAAAGAA